MPEHELACCMVPIFTEHVDIPRLLRAYNNDFFTLENLLESEPGVLLAKLRWRVDAMVTSDSENHPANEDDPRGALLNDLAVVGALEARFGSGVSVAFRVDTFTFSAIVNCNDDQALTAWQLLQQYAVAFLQSLGANSVNPC